VSEIKSRWSHPAAFYFNKFLATDETRMENKNAATVARNGFVKICFNTWD
jgi:hypothetical protein